MSEEKKKKFLSEDLTVVLYKMKEWCEHEEYFETCGLIGLADNGEYSIKECRNLSQDPTNTFILDPLDYLFFSEEFKLLCIYHSHPKGDTEPSQMDVKASENACVPFLIYSNEEKKCELYNPRTSEVDSDLIEKIKKLV